MNSHRLYQIAGIQIEISPVTYEPREDSFLLMDVLTELKSSINPRVILELGTGSGIIAISAARLYPTARIIATDISIACLIAQKNAKRNNCAIECLRGDLFSPFREKGHQFDLIMMNPPYVVSKSLKTREKGINFQDRSWAGGKKGREVILRFLKEANSYLRAQGIVILLVSSQNDPNFIKHEIKKNKFIIILERIRKVPMERLTALVLEKTVQQET